VTYDYVVGDTKLKNMVAAGLVLIKNGVISDSFDQ
jgi:hypothetical protein